MTVYRIFGVFVISPDHSINFFRLYNIQNYSGNMKTTALFLMLMFTGGFSLVAQMSDPAVFILFNDEARHQKLVEDHPRSLLAVADNDPKAALGDWLSFLQNIETYAASINYDLKGVQLYLHAFWDTDGSIDALGYFLQPESRNVPEEELSVFFRKFIENYEPKLISEKKFSHYTSVSFPTFVERGQ